MHLSCAFSSEQAFSVLLGNSPPSVDLMGIGVGHLYFFLDDVLPHTRGGRGRQPLRSPAWLLRLIGDQEVGVATFTTPVAVPRDG